MYYFSTKDLAVLTGISAATLRMWHQRHGLLQPKQKNSKLRLYGHEDLKKLFRLSSLYLHGIKIAQLAAYSANELAKEVVELYNQSSVPVFCIMQLLESAFFFDKETFSKRFDSTISKLGFKTCVTEVCYPLLQKLERLTKSPNDMRTLQQFCSFIIQHKIIAETEILPLPTHKAPEIVLLSPTATEFAIPLHFINYLLRDGGWTTLFLGTNVKMKLLKPLAFQKNISHIFIHLPTQAAGSSFDDYLGEVCKMFAQQTIVTSGNGIFTLQRSFTNLHLLHSDAAIYQFALNRSVT